MYESGSRLWGHVITMITMSKHMVLHYVLRNVFPIIQHNSKFTTYNVLQLPAGTITQTPKYLQISTMSSNDAQKEIEQELKVVQKMYEDSFITREQLSKIQSVIFNHTAPTSIAASDDTSRVLRSNSNVTIRPRKRALDRCQINFAQVG